MQTVTIFRDKGGGKSCRHGPAQSRQMTKLVINQKREVIQIKGGGGGGGGGAIRRLVHGSQQLHRELTH